MKISLSLFSTLLLFFSLASAQAPQITWQQLLGGSDTDALYDMQPTPDGGFILSGTTNSNDGDIDIALGDYDFWIVKLHPNGTVEWKKSFGGSDWDWPRTVIPTPDNGYLVAGMTFSEDGDVTGFKGFRDGWIVKLDNNGNLLWQKCVGGTGADEVVDAVVMDDGGYLILSQTWSNDGDLAGIGDGSNEYWLFKLTVNGEFVWSKCFGGSDEDIPAALVKTSGQESYVAVGKSESNNGDVPANAGREDGWLLQVSPTGQMLNSLNFGYSDWDEFLDVAATADGGVAISGFIYNESVITDYWVLKLGADFGLEWEKTYGGSGEEEATFITNDGNGGYFLGGVTNSTDGDISQYNGGGGDFWILKLNNNGEIIWEKTYGGSDYEKAYALQNTEDGGLLVAGYTNSQDGDVSAHHHGDDDIWLVKLGGNPVTTINLSQNLGIQIFPNPANYYTVLNSNEELSDEVLVRVTDSQGALVFSKVLPPGSNWTLFTGDLAPGLYFTELHNQGRKAIHKLIKN